VDVAGAQSAPFQVAELVEDEQRVIAGAAEMTIVGRPFLLAMGWAHAGVHVEHHRLYGAAGMHGIDPAPGQIGECVQVGLLGQHLGLEAAHLAGGGGLICHGPTTDDPAHGRIVCQPVSIVDVLVRGQPTEDGLPDLCCQGVAAIPAGPGVGENRPGKASQAESVIKFPKGEQAGIGGDPGAVESSFRQRLNPSRRPASGASPTGCSIPGPSHDSYLADPYTKSAGRRTKSRCHPGVAGWTPPKTPSSHKTGLNKSKT
jgi:hypothetical protein